MKKKLWLVLPVAAVLVLLLLLLLKENEGRVSAESKLRNIQMRLASFTSEKANVINAYESEVVRLQAQLVRASDDFEKFTAEKNTQLTGLGSEMQQAAVRHDTMMKQKTYELETTQKQSKEETARFEGLLKEKNSQITDLSAQIEASSKKVSALLKKTQTLETKNLEAQKKISTLNVELDRVRRQHDKLAQLVQAAKKEAAQDPLD